MKSIRVPLLALMLCGAISAPPVSAVGETSQQWSLSGWLQQRAPLVYSADGRWRYHMDAGQVLHRTGNGVQASVQSIKLPVNAMTLASSFSGDRVAFLSESVCIGVASFGAAGLPVVRWVASAAPAPHYNSSQLKAPGMRPESECGGPAVNAIDISSDGRLLATPFHVIEIDSGKVIAQLPKSTGEAHQRTVVKLAFIDNHRRLLVFSRTLGEGYESLAMPSRLQIAVWDVDAGTLRRLDTIDSGEGALGIANFVDYSPVTGAAWRVDHSANLASQRNWKPGRMQAPLQLARHQLDRCGAPWEFLVKLDPHESDNILVDPQGRWVATVRKRKIEARGNFNALHIDEDVLVRDTVRGKLIARFHAPGGIRGLTASPDGTMLHGLTAVPARERSGPRLHFGGDPVSFRIPHRSLPLSSRRPAPHSAACKVEDETPRARRVSRMVRMLDPLWTLATDEHATLFAGRANTLWLDAGSAIHTLEPRTGKTLRSFPSGRTDQTPRFAVPQSGGFLIADDANLAWVPFAPRGGARQGRRIIDRRPGWRIGQLHLQGRGVVAFWSAYDNTPVPAKAGEGAPLRARVVTYDARTLRAMASRAVQEDELGMLGDYTERQYAGAYFPMCADSVGPIRSGFDWRLSHFDSVRLVACGPGATRTILWSHLDVRPRPVSETSPSFEQERAVLGRDGHLSVARVGNLLRVFDSAARSEVAQISLAGKNDPVSALVMAPEGLIVVQAGVQREAGPSREVSAYAIRPAAAAYVDKK